MRGLSDGRTPRPARMGGHRASDRREARPRAGSGPDGDIARIPRGPPAVRAGGARSGGATTLLRRPADGSPPLAAEPPSVPIGTDGARARVAALPRGAAVRRRCVDGEPMD